MKGRVKGKFRRSAMALLKKWLRDNGGGQGNDPQINVTMTLSPERATESRLQATTVKHAMPVQTSITDSNELMNDLKIDYAFTSKAKGDFNSLNVRKVFKTPKR